MEMILVGGLVFGIAYAFTHRGSNRIGTDDWQPARPVAGVERRLRTRDAGSGTQRGAGVQLARVEGRQLLRNEMFIVGIFMSIAILVIFGVVWASDSLGAENSWRYWLGVLPVFTLPFAGMTLVAMNLAVLRARREGTEELFGSLPATATTRVVGHLGSVWMALVVQILFVAATFAIGRFVTDHFGAIDAASVGDVVGQLRARGLRRIARCRVGALAAESPRRPRRADRAGVRRIRHRGDRRPPLEPHPPVVDLAPLPRS